MPSLLRISIARIIEDFSISLFFSRSLYKNFNYVNCNNILNVSRGYHTEVAIKPLAAPLIPCIAPSILIILFIMETTNIFNIDEKEVDTLLTFLRKRFNPVLTLERVHPKLKELYEKRLQHYADNMSVDPISIIKSKLVRLPKEKMNNEERMLRAFLSDTNLKEDLPVLMEYLGALFILISKNYSDRYEDIIIDLVVENGLANFYSDRIKHYLPYEEEEDEPIKEPV
jgi:hypothetical protein